MRKLRSILFLRGDLDGWHLRPTLHQILGDPKLRGGQGGPTGRPQTELDGLFCQILD